MAFRQPLQKVKTSAPIKTSERKILRQQVMEAFSLTQEDGEILVPDQICSFKFSTHAKEQGVAYTSKDGEPLWFLLGKQSTEFIPSVYTLWKKADLLPILYIPSSVTPILVNGANLMMQGVLQKPKNVRKNHLVSITPHICDSKLISFPVAVGRMAVDSESIPGNGEGKATEIIHVYEDNLWLMGSETKLPKPAAVHMSTAIEPSAEESESAEEEMDDSMSLGRPENVTLPPEEVTSLLRLSTIQAIRTLLSTLPPASFPIPSSLLYSSYILPCRPATVLSHGTAVNIKTSSHKNLTSFLKSLEKAGLLKLKDFKGDLNILGIDAKHPEILQHEIYKTISDVEEENVNSVSERKERKRMRVKRLWEPSNPAIKQIFDSCRKDTKGFYTLEELSTIINEYIARHSLATNSKDDRCINLDQTLQHATSSAGQKRSSSMNRGEIVRRICKKMEPSYEITINDEESVRRKGPLKSIEVTFQAGVRAETVVQFFQYFLINADFLSGEVRKICSAPANVTNNKGNEIVTIRGKHVKPVVEFLLSQGVPRRYIKCPGS